MWKTKTVATHKLLFATYFVIYFLDKLRNLLAVCCSRWLTFFLLDHMYLMIPYTNLTILHMWLMIETSIIASLLSRKFRQKERIQLNLLPALANSVRQPSFLTAHPSTNLDKTQLIDGGLPREILYHSCRILSIQRHLRVSYFYA